MLLLEVNGKCILTSLWKLEVIVWPLELPRPLRPHAVVEPATSNPVITIPVVAGPAVPEVTAPEATIPATGRA
ncbi:hypothetical protein ACU8KH_02488 [Lachancea thermotolerans]